jgi:hypothetical protein
MFAGIVLVNIKSKTQKLFEAMTLVNAKDFLRSQLIPYRGKLECLSLSVGLPCRPI